MILTSKACLDLFVCLGCLVLVLFGFVFLPFETGSYNVANASLKLEISLPLSLQWWDHCYAQPFVPILFHLQAVHTFGDSHNWVFWKTGNEDIGPILLF